MAKHTFTTLCMKGLTAFICELFSQKKLHYRWVLNTPLLNMLKFNNEGMLPN